MPKFYYTGGKSGWIGDQPFVYLNTNKIRKLGWKNKFNIRDSIKMTVDWLNNNKWIFNLPKQPIQGKYQHNNDSFREIPILLKSKNKDVDLIYSTDTNHCCRW